MRRPFTRALVSGAILLSLTAAACSRGDEDTVGGAASAPSQAGEDVSPVPTGSTGAVTGASGLSGSLGETGATGATGTADPVPVTAIEYEFRLAGPVPPGEAGFVLRNEGEEPHELQVLQLTGGRTIEDIEALLDGGVPDKPPSWVEPVTGTFARPGRTSEPAVGALEQGQSYVIACFVPTEKGVPHAALGMIDELEVGSG